MVRRKESDGVRSELDTAGICLGAALAGEDTPEGDVGRMMLAALCMDAHAIATRPG